MNRWFLMISLTVVALFPKFMEKPEMTHIAVANAAEVNGEIKRGSVEKTLEKRPDPAKHCPETAARAKERGGTVVVNGRGNCSIAYEHVSQLPGYEQMDFAWASKENLGQVDERDLKVVPEKRRGKR